MDPIDEKKEVHAFTTNVPSAPSIPSILEVPESPVFPRKVHSFRCLKSTNPKVLILFCGGTLVMHEDHTGALVVNDNIENSTEMVLSFEPRISEFADLEMKYVSNIDSTNMSPELWDKLGSIISENYDAYDGFVITHGTDTMAYTASALSFSLQDLGKPVVLTGSQIPGNKVGTDARRNFINAVRVATLQKAGVMVVFDVDIMLGARTSKVSESKLDSFREVNWSLLGEMRIDIVFSRDAPDRHDRPLQFQPGFEQSIIVFTLFPGFDAAHIIAAIESGVTGIILQGFGSGNINAKYYDSVQFAHKKQIPVVVTTQCLEGSTRMHVYETGKKFLESGVIQAYDMTLECITTKLMWAIAHASKEEETVGLSRTELVKEIMHFNYCGEINKDYKLY